MDEETAGEIHGCSMQPCNYGCWNLGWPALHRAAQMTELCRGIVWLTRRALACCSQKTAFVKADHEAQTACAACTTPSLWLPLFIGTSDSTVLPPPGVRRGARVLAGKRSLAKPGDEEWCCQRGRAARDPEARKQQAGPPKRRLRAKGDESQGMNGLRWKRYHQRGHPPKYDSIGRFSVVCRRSQPSVRDVVRALSTRN
ncbi:hypothetical protein FB451DRAFT_1277800 [Mycena latifolia]|nr:hypothetical protein FB451DRAFT_1277800 [Mycena latifolia]